jgi:hypothetical protein
MTVQRPLLSQSGQKIRTPLLGADSLPSHQWHDPLIMALARYVETLHERYPDGPEQMRKENLDARANMRRMRKSNNGRAA